jgi:tetratricopeptide (TPR) repeat protein
VALYIEGDSLWAIHPLGMLKLPELLDESTLFQYLVEVAAVDPENVNVYDTLAQEYRRRGDLAAARRTFEHLFRIDKALPPGYRLMLGDVYSDLGETEKAREQYLGFISELELLIEASPDNLNLKNLLARFCVGHNLRLELAERTIRSAVDAEPEKSPFLLTLGRLQLALHKFSEAARTLGRVVELCSPSYDALYYLGLSYLGIDDSQKARQAFERAIELDPEREEAQEALHQLETAAE